MAWQGDNYNDTSVCVGEAKNYFLLAAKVCHIKPNSAQISQVPFSNAAFRTSQTQKHRKAFCIVNLSNSFVASACETQRKVGNTLIFLVIKNDNYT